MNVALVYETGEVAVATWEQTVIVASRTALTIPALEQFVAATERLAREGAVASLLVVGERTEMPTPVELQAVSAAMRQSRATCAARVVPGRGMWATALRGMLTSAQSSSGDERPRAAFSTVRDAATWLTRTMARDATYRARLTTIAGTLVYGSPSWNRRSQIQSYLADDDDGTGQ